MIVRWKPKLHYKAIASWYHARDMEAPALHQLPELGFIVDDRVAGFIYRTDSSVALIDGVISNPYTLPAARKLSLEKLAGLLVDTAVQLGYEDIIFTSKNESVKELGERMGFKKTNQQLFILNSPEIIEEEDEHLYGEQ